MNLGESGQLGLGATDRAKTALNKWVEVNALRGRQVISLGCGSRHSAVVTTAGDVYTWGRGFEGQTGHAPVSFKPCKAEQMTAPSKNLLNCPSNSASVSSTIAKKPRPVQICNDSKAGPHIISKVYRFLVCRFLIRPFAA